MCPTHTRPDGAVTSNKQTTPLSSANNTWMTSAVAEVTENNKSAVTFTKQSSKAKLGHCRTSTDAPTRESSSPSPPPNKALLQTVMLLLASLHLNRCEKGPSQLHTPAETCRTLQTFSPPLPAPQPATPLLISPLCIHSSGQSSTHFNIHSRQQGNTCKCSILPANICGHRAPYAQQN